MTLMPLLEPAFPAFADAVDRPAQLTLRLHLSTPEILQFEPLLVTLEVCNETDIPIGVSEHHLAVVYYARKDGGEFEPLACNYDWRMSGSVVKTYGYEPGGRPYVRDEVLLWRGDHPLALGGRGDGYVDFSDRPFVFSEPGTYEIKARVFTEGRNRKDTLLESATVKLLVNPVEERLRPAAELMMARGVARFLDGRTHDPAAETLDKLFTLLREYPASPYADYVNYRLGSWHRWRYQDIRPPSPAEAVKAVKYFGDVSLRIPALRHRATYYTLTLPWRGYGLMYHVDYEHLREAVAEIEGSLFEHLIRTSGELRLRELRWGLRIVEILYIDDPRLDKIIDCRFGRPAPFVKILERAQSQTDVPLSMALVPKTGICNPVDQYCGPLRNWMLSIHNGHLWVRDGSGYKLITREEAEAADKAAPPPEERAPTATEPSRRRLWKFPFRRPGGARRGRLLRR